MKKLDDLVFKNLHGLKDEEDEIKHKHEKKPGNTQGNEQGFPSNMQNDYEKMLEMQQQQQQMMYNYYNNPYANKMQQQQLNTQGFQQPNFNTGNIQNMQNMQNLQNRQNMQGNLQYNVNMMNNQNAYNLSSGNPQQMQMNMNQFNQQQIGNFQNIPQLANNTSFAQLNPLMQKQILQMYQMQQLKQQQNSGGQGMQMGQMGGNNLQGNQAYMMYQQGQGNQQNQAKVQTNNSPYFNANVNEGISPGIQSQGGFGSSPGFPISSQHSQQTASMKSPFEDDFSDFQSSNTQKTTQQSSFNTGFNMSQGFGNNNVNNAAGGEDDFDDFQGAQSGGASKTGGEDDGFDDFKGAPTNQNNNSPPKEKNWDILDDFVEKKELSAPQVQPKQVIAPANSQIYQQIQQYQLQMQQQQNANYLAAQQQQQQANLGNVNMFGQVQGQGFPQHPQGNGNITSIGNKEDDFDDFEEAKPTTQATTQQGGKASSKEDILFGALERKFKKEILHEEVQIEQEIDDGFGEFERSNKPQPPQGNVWSMDFGGTQQEQQHHHQAGGDDFEDFAEAGHQQTGNNVEPPGQKLTIYDIDLAEFGITDAQQELKTTEPPKNTNIPQQNIPNVAIKDEHEDFGDFVEIKEEKEEIPVAQNKQKESYNNNNSNNFYERSTDLDFGLGVGTNEFERKPVASVDMWDFGNGDMGANNNNNNNSKPPQNNLQNMDDFGDFGGFGEHQGAAAKVEIKEEHDDFAGFQFAATGEPTQHQQQEKPKQDNDWDNIDFGGDSKWEEAKAKPPKESNGDGDFDFGDFQDHGAQPQEVKKEQGGLDGFDFGTVNVHTTVGQTQNTFFDNEPVVNNNNNNNKQDLWADFDQGFGEVQQAEKQQTTNEMKWGNEEVQIQEEKTHNNDEDFGDFGDFTATTTHKVEEKQPEAHHKADPWDHDVFSERKVEPKAQAQSPQKEDDHDDGFGDFDEGGKHHKEEPKENKNEAEIEEETTTPLEKKMTVYDIDFTEFGIEEKQNQGLPPLELNLGFGPIKESPDSSAKIETPATATKGLSDLYSLYGNVATTPELKTEPKQQEEKPHEEEDLFGAFAGTVQQNIAEPFGDFSGALIQNNNNNPDPFGDFAATPFQNVQEPEEFTTTPGVKTVVNEPQQHDEFEGFDNFAEAGFDNNEQKQVTTTNNFTEIETPADLYNQKNNTANLFTDPFEQPTPVNYDDESSQGGGGFGDFEDASPALDVRVEPSHDEIIEHNKASPVIEKDDEDGDDGFGDFDEVRHEEAQPEKDEIPGKSLSNLGASMLPQETSDFGSLAEVPHKGKDIIGSIREKGRGREEEKGEEGDDFGSFNDGEAEAEQEAENNKRKMRQHEFDQKDESIFNAVESSDDSPIKDKEKNHLIENDDEFGDFEATSNQQEKAESGSVPEVTQPEEKYDLETVLGQYGIPVNNEAKEGKEDRGEDWTEEINVRVGEIMEGYERDLYESALMRKSLSGSKFKINGEIIEDFVRELKSLQKYQDALLTHGQIQVAQEIKTLNETKARLIEEEELEEAIKYRDIIKNKEKELFPKEKFEEYAGYYQNIERRDYRVILLDELRKANVSNKYINHFYVRFLGKTTAYKRPEVVVPVEKNEVKNEEQENPIEENQKEEGQVEEVNKEAVVEESVQEKEKGEVEENVPEKEVEEKEKEDVKAVEENVYVQTENENQDNNDNDNKEEQNEEKENPENAENVEKEEHQELSVQPEAEKEEKVEAKEEEGFEDFNQADTETQPQAENVAIVDEDDKKEEEVNEKKEEGQEEDGFEEFNQVEPTATEQNTEKIVEVKKEETEEENKDVQKSEEVKEDDGFDDFNQAVPETQEHTENIAHTEEQVEIEEEKKDQGEGEDDGFDDFNEAEPVTQQNGENIKSEGAEIEEKKQNVENEDEEDEGFGDFGEAEPVKKEEIAQYSNNEIQNQVEDDGFEDYGQADHTNQVQVTENQRLEQANENNQEEDDGFEDFDQADTTNQPQTQTQPENQTQAETNNNNNNKLYEEDNLYEAEVIPIEKTPETLEELQELKEKTTKWALLAKVISASSEDFDINLKKVLKQIIFELYRFDKISSSLLQESNTDIIKAVLNSEKFEGYVKGILVLTKFYTELDSALEFVGIRKNYIRRYGGVIEEIQKKVENVRTEIKEKYNREYYLLSGTRQDAVKEQEGRGQEWLTLTGNGKLGKEVLSHVCHLSLNVDLNELTEYSGKYYFLPYLNFLLSNNNA